LPETLTNGGSSLKDAITGVVIPLIQGYLSNPRHLF